MKDVKIKNPMLESVYDYYTDASNYLGESLSEEGRCITVDDRLFNDLMDMIHTGTYAEAANGHILIPTEGGYTFHVTPDHELYLDDDRGNELEARIDPRKLIRLVRAVKDPRYKMVSEGNGNNAFTHVEQDPETKFIKFSKKDSVSPDEARRAAHIAVEKARARRAAEREDAENGMSLADRFNDPEYRDKVADYWDNRRANMAEPHGFGTGGTKSLFRSDALISEEATDEGDVYDPAAVKPDVAQDGSPTGLVNEAGLSRMIRDIIKEKNTINMIKQLNESQLCDLIAAAASRVLRESFGPDPEVGEDEYRMIQDYLNSPDGGGMPVNSLSDDIAQDYADFFAPEENPAETSFREEGNTPTEETPETYDRLLEDRNRADMEERQDRLLTFIIENYDNHANSLIK